MKAHNFTVTSNNNNHYLISPVAPGAALLHPIQKHLLKLQKDGVHIPTWIENLPPTITLDVNIHAEKNDVIRHYNFLRQLAKARTSDALEITPMTGDRYTAEMIEQYLVNADHIIFEVTDACNLNCTYCGYGELYRWSDPRENKHLSLTTAKSLIDTLHHLKETKGNLKIFKKITIGFYGGEPLLNMRFIKEIVSYVKSKPWTNIGLRFQMTTNGVLLDKYMDYIVENRFTLGVSLDGDAESNGYRVFHNGAPSFDTVYRNILALKEKHPAYFDQQAGLYMVIHKKNSLKAAAAFMEKAFNKTPMAMELTTVGVSTDKLHEFHQIYKKAYNALKPGDMKAFAKDRKILEKHPARNRLHRFFSTHTNYKIKKYSQLLGDKPRKFAVSTGTCNPFKQKVFLTVNGKILPCERIPQNYYLGKADDHGVKIDFQQVADKYNRWYEKLGRTCNRCRGNHQCDQCIFMMDLEAPVCACDNFKSDEAYESEVAENISLLEETPRLYASILKQ